MKNLMLTGALLLMTALPAAAQTTDSLTVRTEEGEALPTMTERPAATPKTDSLTISTEERTASGIDTLRRIDPTGSDLLKLRAGTENGEVVLEAGGFKLTLGQTYMSRTVDSKAQQRGNISMFSNWEFGWTHLSGVGYDGYPAGTGDFLDQELWPSFHLGFTIVQLNVRLSQYKMRRKGWWFAVGLNYTLDNIRLSNTSITLGNENGRIVPVTLDEAAKKSKIKYSSLGIPIRLTYAPAKHLAVTATLYNDFVLATDAIYKKPKQRHTLSGLNGYQCGAGLAVSYRGFGFFVRKSLTPLFKSGSGIDAGTFTFGIGCGF